jgi:hypothetical protein
MHGEAAVWTRRLRREFGDDRLAVRWNEDLCRYQVGQKVGTGGADHIDWFYTVTDGSNGFRPLDQRTIRKIASMDKRRMKLPTADELRRQRETAAAEAREKRGAEIRYRISHEAEFYRGRFGFDA